MATTKNRDKDNRKARKVKERGGILLVPGDAVGDPLNMDPDIFVDNLLLFMSEPLDPRT